jgi:hypothetical protein
VSGAFLEAPDPRQIERALENVISDVLRKQLQKNGELQKTALHINELMNQVIGGARELEARRRAVESAEEDLRSRSLLATHDQREVLSAQIRLMEAWDGFQETLIGTKSAFITLVSELEAMGHSSSGQLRPQRLPQTQTVRADPRVELVDFLTDRMLDTGFAARQDELLERAGPAVPVNARELIDGHARMYRQRIIDAQKIQASNLSPAEKMTELASNDVYSSRQRLRHHIERVITGLGALDARLNPVAAEIVSFVSEEAQRAAGELGATRQKRDLSSDMRDVFVKSTSLTTAAKDSFARLDVLENAAEDAREELLAASARQSGTDVHRFISQDQRLDQYLKAQRAFDDEVARTLDSGTFSRDPALIRLLSARYDVSASF